MNVHGALNHRVWRVGVHHVEYRMNSLVALDPQERCSKDLFRRGTALAFKLRNDSLFGAFELPFMPDQSD